MTPDKSAVKFLSVEGGGAAGLAVHPGALRALADAKIDVLRYSARKQIGIEAFAGSSSGSIIATLASVGYTADEITTLVGPDAFDFVFGLENIASGEFMAIGASNRSNTSTKTRSLPKTYNKSDWVNKIKSKDFWYLLDNLPDYLLDVSATNVTAALKLYVVERALANMIPLNASVATKYPIVVQKINNYMATAGIVAKPSFLGILNSDYGFFSGACWRDYVDAAIAFALFRVNEGSELPQLELPNVTAGAATSPQNLFIDYINQRWYDARNSEGWSPTRPQADYEEKYKQYLFCTFEKHAALYDWVLSDGPSPLNITGSNLNTQQSEVFSAEKTPGFLVADAVRIAMCIPPVFKPVYIEDSDVLSEWPQDKDRFGNDRYIEGLWIDGGLYDNSPIDVFAKYESETRRAFGLGIGIESRVEIGSFMRYARSLINVVYEHTISSTRIDLNYFVDCDRSNIDLLAPKPSTSEIQAAQDKAAGKIFDRFGIKP